MASATPSTQQPELMANTAKDEASAGTKSPSSQQDGSSDAIALLTADHRSVEALFSEYERASGGRKARLIKQICQELVIHAMLEEEIFYPACREAASDEDPMDEAQVEHDSAKILIADLMKGGRAERYRDAKVKVLAEQIRHHVAEEEKPREGVFAKAKAAGVDTSELTQRLKARKEELAAKPSDLPNPRPVSFQTTQNQETKETLMARGDNDRDERGRFSSDDDRGGRGGGGRSGGGRSRDDDDRSYRSRGRDDDDGRGWYGDSEGHAEAARRGWAERSGESRSFSRGRDDDDDRGGRGGDRDRDERGRFASDDDRSSRSRSRYDDDDDRGGRSGSSRDRDERGRFMSDDDDRGSRSRSRYDEDDRGYRSRSRDDDDDDRRGRGVSGRDRDERGRFTSDDDDDRRYRSSSRDDDDDRGSRGRSGGGGQGGWFGDSRGHSEAARRGWEERDGGSRSRSSRDDDDDRSRSRSRSRDDDDDRGRGRSSGGQGGWFGDSRGHAEAARRGWQDRR